MNDYKKKIIEILNTIFDEYEGEITEDLVKEDIDQWDSLASAQIIMAIENEFNKHLSDEEVASINSVANILKLVIGDDIYGVL
ncbi:acyl carrier protein [Clostridium felsineum]|uniref:acyl carrier protein n=1 Tax=Clostridium felsineum TaxID=36839 RepID=UPI00098C2703|nr:acyl carrier protein [Clostridium felsineum]URZ18155.1 hypothetical protein CLFE_042100 [Clostridium felsineum DSM 794]